MSVGERSTKREGATRRLLLQSAGAVTLFQLPAWAQAPLAKPDRSQERCGLAVIGHLGHGKTTLTAAITKVLAEQARATFTPHQRIHAAPQEVAYGSRMAIARLQYETEKRRYAQIDCPSHGDYVKAMISGTAAIDGAILVVSADDGPLPQTREHVLLARDTGIPAIVVFLSKLDLIGSDHDDEHVNLVEEDVRDILSKYNFAADKVPVIRGSALAALQGKNDEGGRRQILRLLEAVDNSVAQAPPLKERSFLMPITSVASLGARGTGVTGRVERGVIKAGEDVEVVGLRTTQKRRVAIVELSDHPAGHAEATQDVRCILHEAAGSAISTGQVLCKPGSVQSHTKFTAEIYFLAKSEGGRTAPLFPNYRSEFRFRTARVTGALRFPDGSEMAMPGDNLGFIVELTAPVALEKSLRFTLHEGDRTVGMGVVSSIVK